MSSFLRPIVVKYNKGVIMITLEQIREKLIEAIKQSGLSQKEIGKKINVSQQTISCYLNGLKLPSLDTFANLCPALKK